MNKMSLAFSKDKVIQENNGYIHLMKILFLINL